jgi:hypothetical protein
MGSLVKIAHLSVLDGHQAKFGWCLRLMDCFFVDRAVSLLRFIEARSENEIDTAFADAKRQRADAVIVSTDRAGAARSAMWANPPSRSPLVPFDAPLESLRRAKEGRASDRPVEARRAKTGSATQAAWSVRNAG